MKKIILVILLFLPLYSRAQDHTLHPKHFISLSGGFGKHGSGDMRGFSENVSFWTYFRKKLAWSVGIGSSLHDGEYPMVTVVNGVSYDNSYRYTTGAVQLTSGISFSVIRSVKSEFGVRVNGLVRYQSSSYYDHLEIISDPNNPIPFPATYIFNTSAQRTIALGVSPELFFNQAISKTIFLGISCNFQADTNGDVLTNVSLSLGKRFH